MNVIEKILTKRQFKFHACDHDPVLDGAYTCKYSVHRVVGKTIHVWMDDIRWRGCQYVEGLHIYRYMRKNHHDIFEKLLVKDVCARIQNYLYHETLSDYVFIHKWSGYDLDGKASV
jgi:hypothetical protein